MLSWMRSRLSKREEGFTLIELMVVVLIIAILVAIAVPTFLNQRQNAQNRAAQSDLRNGLSAVKAYYAENQEFTGSTTAMDAIEPNLDWGGDLVIAVNGTQAVCLSMESETGNWYAIYEDANAGTEFGADTSSPYANPLATCDGSHTGFSTDVDAVW